MRTIVSSKGADSLSPHQIRSGAYQRLELSAAHEVLPMVQKITRKAVQKLEPIQTRLNNMLPADPRIAQVKRAYSSVVEAWVGKIERLGFKVLGLWQVGFDGGAGWYGWQYPERSIRYFLEYHALFSDRCLIRDFQRTQNHSRLVRK